MPPPSIDTTSDRVTAEPGRVPIGPVLILALAWVSGTWVGGTTGHAARWLAAASISTAAMLVMVALRRSRTVRTWGILTLVAISAAWSVMRLAHVATDDVSRLLQEDRRLAEVTGTIANHPVLTTPRRGAFGRFSYRSPGTRALLNVQQARVGEHPKQASGALILNIHQADARLRQGDRVTVRGWLTPITPPSNPGEFDYRAYMATRGVHGRISAPGHAQVQILPRNGHIKHPQDRPFLAGAAASSLRRGMNPDTPALWFLDAILLGERTDELEPIGESFRQVGLAHLLSISGAHLGILLFMITLIARLVIANPPRTALVILAALALFLLIIPPRVPILRAGLMAAMFGIAYGTGRSSNPLTVLALAAAVLLAWRPADLWAPGFQLSFGIVAAMIVFTKPISQWLWSVPDFAQNRFTLRYKILGGLSKYAAANIVAALIALPIVAHHFGYISPLAPLLSFIALPFVGFTLALGYLKIVTGLLLPSLGIILATPLTWAAQLNIWLVDRVADWPISSFELTNQITTHWTIAALITAIALLLGWFSRRPLAAIASISLCIVGLLGHQLDGGTWPWPHHQTQPALKLNMLAVGDGACYLVRLHDSDPTQQSQNHTLMFDCGSQAYLDVGAKTIAPALRELGVTRIDTLLISHADLDHFSGTLDLADQVHIKQILAPPQLLHRAAASPRSSVAYLIDELKSRDIPVTTVTQGWRASSAGADLKILWPSNDQPTEPSNDTSLVLSIRTANRHLLLNGDIQEQATSSLIKNHAQLQADITDLPHHGAFTDASPDWLNAVQPQIALQSSGRARLANDRWKPLLDHRQTIRLATPTLGMVEIKIEQNGTVTWTSYRGNSGSLPTIKRRNDELRNE